MVDYPLLIVYSGRITIKGKFIMSETIEKPKKKRTRLAKDHKHYVNNRELLEAATRYRISYDEWRDSDFTIAKPPIPDDLAGMIIKICERTVYSPDFIGYPHLREDMVADAISVCMVYAHNFDPNAETRSGTPNPFAYYTQFARNAYIHRIVKEQQQYKTKVKWVQSEEMADQVSEIFENVDDLDLNSSNVLTLVRSYYDAELPNEPTKKVEEQPKEKEEYIESGLELFFA